MRIALDTNVLIAAFISCGSCSELLECLVKNHTVVSSAFILDELREKLSTKFKLDAEMIDRLIALLLKKVVVVTPSALPTQACRDSDDDNVLGTAIAGKCAYLITGDKDLIDMKQYSGIDIIRPNEFWKLEQEKKL